MTLHIDTDGIETNTNVAAFTTYGNPPETLLKHCRKHADKVSEVGNEGEDGYWVYLTDGWIDGESGARAIHEHTVKSCINRFAFLRRETDEEGKANNSNWWRNKVV